MQLALGEFEQGQFASFRQKNRAFLNQKLHTQLGRTYKHYSGTLTAVLKTSLDIFPEFHSAC